MAISSELIGSLGASEVTNSRFWFSSSTRSASDLDKSWNVPRGNYLFAWYGTLDSTVAINSSLLINGETLVAFSASNSKGTHIGGYVYLQDVTSIVLTGVGAKRFEEDPYAVFVKVK